ncbi:MAG: tRNA1(Val) (adenine(37)-N6)-methyltransferase [Bacilli bacterium]
MKKEELRLDYLKNHPELKLYQSKEMFRINTDTCLLGEFLDLKVDDNVLDVGTNNGALLIYASLQTKGHLVGIDINKEALEIASLNMEEHNIQNVTLLHEDFSSFVSEEKFKVIISNPPYFATKDDNSKNLNIYLRNARHEEFLLLDDLCKGISLNLTEDGSFFLVHRPERLQEIENTLLKYHLYINKLVYVFDERSKKIVTILIKGSYSSLNKEEDNIHINGF